MTGKNGWKSILSLALPISLQSLFQSSFSVIDQIMVGQVGTASVAAIGLGAIFPNFFTVTLAAIGTTASIMIAQFCGVRDGRNVDRSFRANVLAAGAVTLAFLIPCLLLSEQIIGLYTTDGSIIPPAGRYLRIVSAGFPALLVTTMLSALLRNTGRANVPMMTGILSVSMNTLLNYLLIFGHFGFPALGVDGSALATTVSRWAEALLLLLIFLAEQKNLEYRIRPEAAIPIGILRRTLVIASPVVANEFMWGLGQTAYAAVYGRMGTGDMAAMTLTLPVQNLSIGLFTGVSAAASILVGNCLGQGDNTAARRLSLHFFRIGIAGSAGAGALLAVFADVYTRLFNVSPDVRASCARILYIFAAILSVKVSNMILGGGILRCGGKTQYTLFLDLFGTWAVGVPMGFLAFYGLHLPVHWVYFMISVEEIIRLALEIWIFRSRKWMENLTAAA